MHGRRPALSLILILPGLLAGRALADCASLYESLNDSASIAANGGVITGSLTFAPGVNDAAAVFGGNGYISYTNGVFAAPAGSVALWFRKTSSDEAGGIMQVGADRRKSDYRAGDELRKEG